MRACVRIRAYVCAYAGAGAYVRDIGRKSLIRINVCTSTMDYQFRTAAKEKFMDCVVSGQIKDFQPIPAKLFTKEELRELYLAGNLYMFMDRNGSYFKAVIF